MVSKFFLRVLFLVFFLSPAVVHPQARNDGERPDFVPNELLITFRRDMSPSELLSVGRNLPAHKSITRMMPEQLLRPMAAAGAAGADRLERTYLVTLPGDIKSLKETARAWQGSAEVESVQPNYLYYADGVPNDPYYSTQEFFPGVHPDIYSLKPGKLDAQSAWDVSEGAGSIVAIVDTGISLLHPDLAGSIWENPGEIAGNATDDDGNGKVDDVSGWDFVRSDANPSDENGHGTHVAGIVAAVGNNGVGVIGAAPKAKVMAVRVLDPTGTGSTSTIASGIVYAANEGAHVINLSLGFSSRRPVDDNIGSAIRTAYAAGAVVVASAGNSRDDVAYYSPANLPEAVTVAATDHADKKASFSNYGIGVDISAPGVNILSTFPEDRVSSLTQVGMTIVGESFAPAVRYMRNSSPIPSGGSLSGQVLFAGVGDPSTFLSQNFMGRIALIERGGGLTFANKVANAWSAGASAAIIFNNEPGTFNGDLGNKSGIPGLSMSREDGLKVKDLIAAGETIATVAVTKSIAGYDALSGTSMSAPAVCGAIAVLRSAFPALSREEILKKLYAGADNIDAGNPGFEGALGVGRLNIARALSTVPAPNVRAYALEVKPIKNGSVDLILSLKNFGEAVEGVQVKLLPVTSNLNFTQDTAAYGAIDDLAIVKNGAAPFKLQLTSALAAGSLVEMNAEITGNSGFSAVQKITFTRNYFDDVAQDLGIVSAPGFLGYYGINFGDYDADGYADIFAHGSSTLSYRNEGDGTFASALSFVNGSVAWNTPDDGRVADLDNDGRPELLVVTEGGLWSFEEDGGVFNKTLIWGNSDTFPAGTFYLTDYNNDGRLDVMVRVGGKWLMLKNGGNHMFTDASTESGVLSAGVSSSTVHFSDYDLDGDQDLFTAWRLFKNTEGVFSDVSAAAQLPVLPSGDVIAFPAGIKTGDTDNDGDFDLFLIGLNRRSSQGLRAVEYYRNNGDGTFVNETTLRGFDGNLGHWDISSDLFDYNNDGFLDLFLATGTFSTSHQGFGVIDYLLMNQSGRFFVNASITSGLKGTTESGVASGSTTYADYDRDGDMDVLLNDFWTGAQLFRNTIVDVNSPASHLTVALKGTVSNAEAIGARVEVRTANRKVVREVQSTAAWGNPVHVGLGDAPEIKKVNIFWPSGIKQQFRDAGLLNTTLSVTETSCAAAEKDCLGFCFGNAVLDGSGACIDIDDVAPPVIPTAPPETPTPTRTATPTVTPTSSVPQIVPTPVVLATFTPNSTPKTSRLTKKDLKEARALVKKIKGRKNDKPSAKASLAAFTAKLAAEGAGGNYDRTLKKLFTSAAKLIDKLLKTANLAVNTSDPSKSKSLKKKLATQRKKADAALKAAEEALGTEV